MSGSFLDILKPGLSSTVQDFGRHGLAHLGIPAAGAMDRDAMMIANALVGNRPDTPVLECLQTGPTFRVNADHLSVAIARRGQLLIDGETTRDVAALQSTIVQQGDIVTVKNLQGAACVAVGGGFDTPAVMGSSATYSRGGFGGFHGRSISEGDQIPLAGLRAPGPSLCLPLNQAIEDRLFSRTLRAVPGPQSDHFAKSSRDQFFASSYRITQASDRMGTRLDGPKLRHSTLGFNIPSDAIAFGSVQVPGDGQPIVLGRDRQTTGGYPKIATVLSPDMARLARCRPGEDITFEAMDKPLAEAAFRDHMNWLNRIHEDFVSLGPDDQAIDMEALWSENLISGVVGPDD